ncbi:hypothetical protein AWR27_03310 [Spirosoma montaniterrae]|uniref:Bacterial surface antigen (D15) domain-containing protein n=1 Tax=Spirosoma montaniterrae TaxID=1178516 RepID=A0A1P9X3S6_9BACT|nr:hypothetical protein AWR27_03310 [Spirosoma montaniterrae]
MRTLFFIFHVSLFAYLSGCVAPKNLRNEYLLTAQTIRGNRVIPNDQLESLIPQKPNRRVLGLPITPPLWFYQFGLRRYDREAVLRELQAKTNEFEQQSQLLMNQSGAYAPDALKRLNRRYGRQLKKLRLKAEEGNWLMRNLGEPPTYFARRDAEVNAAKMKSYLENNGFFNATASFTLDTLRRRQIRVNYFVNERAAFHLRTVNYQIADPAIDSLVRGSLNTSVLKVGDRFSFDQLSAEKVRLETLLRDKGYYTFSRQYIRATDVDTTSRITDQRGADDSLYRRVDILIQILNPPGRSAHPIYQIGDVEVRITPDETQPLARTALDTVQRNGITYLLNGRNISARLLDSKISIRPGAPYSLTNYRDTQRQLFLLNQFKFVNVDFTDTTARQLRTRITATPLDKYEYTFEGGLFVLYQSQNNTPGPFGNLTFRVRNLFGGLENLETSVRYGIEAQTGFAGTDQVYRAQELGVTTSLIFPQILLPGRFRFQFNRYNPRTQISLGYTNTYRPDFIRSLLRSTVGYSWQTTPAKQFNVLIADVNLINASTGFNSEISASFQRELDEDQRRGGTLYLSFRRSFASGVSFSYTYNTNTVGQNRRANFFRVVAESGGTTLNFFRDDQLRRLFRTTDTTGLQYYKYLRLNVDYRHYIPLRPRTTLAFRVNSGLVFGYGPGGAAPYEKLFFAGGSNSIRAWLPRRLGPGSELPRPTIEESLNPSPDRVGQFLYTFEKPGDFLLEGSAELRGRLFKLLADVDGAFFIDAGNVWRLPGRGSNNRGEFQLDAFIPQIAVGTGVGLRLDFSFFIVRLDGGVKVWDPARRYTNGEGQLVDERFILPQFTLRRLSKGPNPLVINFGIGYPF